MDASPAKGKRTHGSRRKDEPVRLGAQSLLHTGGRREDEDIGQDARAAERRALVHRCDGEHCGFARKRVRDRGGAVSVAVVLDDGDERGPRPPFEETGVPDDGGKGDDGNG